MFYRLSLICTLFLFSLSSHSENSFTHPALSKTDLGNGTIEYKMDNIKTKLIDSKKLNRSTYFPTQLFDFKATAYVPGMTCDGLLYQLNQIFIGAILNNNFYISGHITCISLPENQGHTINVQGFFDPIDDRALVIAEYLRDHVSGVDFHGTPIFFEDSKGVVFQLMANFGRSAPNKALIRTNYFFTSEKFNSFYEAAGQLLNGVRSGFNPSREELILPMINYVFGAPAAQTANKALREGNMMEILIIPTFLYRTNLQKFPGTVGFQFLNGICGVLDTDTCLPRL